MVPPIVSGIVLAIAIAGVPAGANELDPEVQDRLSKATVYIKAKRHYKGTALPSSGSGFFVHPDGLVLTNWHVVADRLQAKIHGDWRKVATEMKSLTIVVGSGTSRQREVAARVVAHDPEKDLAVLEVPFTPEAWLDITNPEEVDTRHLVWAAGFPAARPMAIESNSQEVIDVGGPLDVVFGAVTTKVKDQEGNVFGLLTDTALRGGFSGGPLVNSNGKVVGVVNPRISRNKEAGRAISSEHLSAFTAKYTIQVEFSPPLVVSPPQPIRITATPLLASLRDTTGTILLVGTDIESAEGKMEPSGELWVGTIPPATKLADRPAPGSYHADLLFVDSEGEVVLKRRYELEAAVTEVDTSGYVAAVDGGELTFSDDNPEIYTERRVSEMASEVKVENVVLDDHNLGINYEPSMAPERYEGLDEGGMLSARCYDKSTRALDSMKRRFARLEEELKRPGYEEDDRYETMDYKDRRDLEAYEDRNSEWEERRRMRKERDRLKYKLLDEYELKVKECTSAVRIADLLYCPVEARWYYRTKVPCSNPVQP